LSLAHNSFPSEVRAEMGVRRWSGDLQLDRVVGCVGCLSVPRETGDLWLQRIEEAVSSYLVKTALTEQS